MYCFSRSWLDCSDLNYVEDSSGVDLPVALLPQSEKVVMLQMDSKLKIEEFEQVMKLAMEGCKKVHEILLEVVRERTNNLVTSRGIFNA